MQPPAPKPGGYSLVELLVAMTIGLVVSAAAIAAVSAIGSAGRHAVALAEITDNANTAMLLLREQLSLAGYAAVRARDGRGRFVREPGGPAVFGCEHGFVNPRVAFDALSCARGRGSAAVALRHEADAGNALLSSDGLPLDCLGNGIAAFPSAFDGRLRHQADTRFYVASNPSGRKELYCKGAGAAAAQPLVEGIEDLRFVYGVASESGLVWHGAGHLGEGDWAGVVAVRVCLLATSAFEVADRPMSFLDCGGVAATAADRRLYRSVTTTIVLPNHPAGDSP